MSRDLLLPGSDILCRKDLRCHRGEGEKRNGGGSMMSRRHKGPFEEDCGDGTIIGPPEQGSKAPAFSVPRERFAPLPPAENPTAFWRVGEQQHVRGTRSGSSPPQGACWVPQATFVRRSYRVASGGGDAYGHFAAAPLNDGSFIAPRGGSAPPTRLDSGGFTPPVEDSLRFDGGGLNAWPCSEDGGLVAATGGGDGGQQEEEEDGEVHGREVGYKVAGLCMARAAASSNALPLPPLYHLLEVAHRQLRRELEEGFAAKEAKMKEEQDRLRSQLRFLEATASKAGNIHQPQPQPSQLTRSRNATGSGDTDTPKANGEGTSATKAEDKDGFEGTAAGDTAVTTDKPGNSAASKDGNMSDTNHVTTENGTNGSSIHDTSIAHLQSNNSGSTSSNSSSSTAQPKSAADRIKAAREAVSISLQELIASGEKLGRMRKEADQARRRVRSMISGPSDDRVAAASMARRSTVGFLQASSAGWLKLSTAAKMRIVSEIERELDLPQLELSKRALTLPGPTKDDQIGAGDGDGDGDGSVGGDGGDVTVTAARGEVEPFLRERLVAPVVAAGIAGKEEGGLKAELEAVKDRLRLTEEQLSKYKALETNAASRAAEAEGSADRLRAQLEVRKRQIEELREISQRNLFRAQRRREVVDLGGKEAGV